MEASHQRCDGGQSSIELRPHGERGDRHVTLDEHKPLTTVVVDTDRHRSTVEARVAQRREEAVDQTRVRVRGPKHMLTNSRHTTGIRHAPSQWYFIHPVIIAGTISAPITTTSNTGILNSAFSPAEGGGVTNSCARTRPPLQRDRLHRALPRCAEHCTVFELRDRGLDGSSVASQLSRIGPT